MLHATSDNVVARIGRPAASSSLAKKVFWQQELYHFEFHGLVWALFSLLFFQNYFNVSFGILQAYHTKKPPNGVTFVQLRI